MMATTPQNGDAEDTGTGLAALLGAFTSGAGSTHPRGPSEPSLSFLYWNCLEVAVPFVRKHTEQLSNFSFLVYSSVSFCSTTVQLCIVFHNLVLGRRL